MNNYLRVSSDRSWSNTIENTGKTGQIIQISKPHRKIETIQKLDSHINITRKVHARATMNNITDKLKYHNH